MRQIEINILHSFKYAKRDIIALQQKVLDLSETQKRLILEIEKLKDDKKTPITTVIKTGIKTERKSTTYVASKTGKKFHKPNCPFAQNIKPKSEVKFKSNNAALNAGYKACKCLNK